MSYLKILTATALFAANAMAISAQTEEAGNSFVHQHEANGYIAPDDPAVLRKLNEWKDLKFGVLFHWGLYSVPGICESWQICSEDWITRPAGYTYESYKKWYWDLSKMFNPYKFDPEQWADIMQDAGMKYMVFTTKHHDGFCMFDSKYTDFTTAKATPFANNPKSDVARYVFDAFREKDFWIGCYFSKPDWHSQWFWNDYYGCAGRGRNYKLDTDEHRQWWENYRTFCKNQLTELTENYGRFDILWLDGGWVKAEDVYLEEVLQKARSGKHPGLISVDRAMKTKWENYQTPERSIPDVQLNYPWESCITLSHAWGWDPSAKFKSPAKVVGILSEICAKGGCLLLGVGPTPEGLIQPEVEQVLRPVGAWLRKNGKAIYSTRTTPVYTNDEKSVWFTAAKDGKTLYAIVPQPDDAPMPATVSWKGNAPKGKMTWIENGKTVKYTTTGDVTTVTLPKGADGKNGVALQFTVR